MSATCAQRDKKTSLVPCALLIFEETTLVANKPPAGTAEEGAEVLSWLTPLPLEGKILLRH